MNIDTYMKKLNTEKPPWIPCELTYDLITGTKASDADRAYKLCGDEAMKIFINYGKEIFYFLNENFPDQIEKIEFAPFKLAILGIVGFCITEYIANIDLSPIEGHNVVRLK